MKKLLYLFAVLFFFSCEDEIDIEHPVSDPIVVIDGDLTTELKNHKVKITYSAPSKSTSPVVTIDNAEVSVFNSKGDEFVYNSSGQGEYESIISYSAQLGEAYHVKIKLPNGDIILSQPEVVVPVPAIDSIYYLHISDYKYVEGPPREIDQETEGYYTFIDFQETPGEGNAYRWKAYVDGEFLSAPEYLSIENDISLNSNLFGEDGSYQKQFDFFFLAPQYSEVKIEMYSISQQYHQYMLTLFFNSIDGGGPFSTPPAPPKGNVYYENDPNGELVLGYFAVSDVVSKSVVMNGTKK